MAGNRVSERDCARLIAWAAQVSSTAEGLAETFSGTSYNEDVRTVAAYLSEIGRSADGLRVWAEIEAESLRGELVGGEEKW